MSFVCQRFPPVKEDKDKAVYEQGRNRDTGFPVMGFVYTDTVHQARQLSVTQPCLFFQPARLLCGSWYRINLSSLCRFRVFPTPEQKRSWPEMAQTPSHLLPQHLSGSSSVNRYGHFWPEIRVIFHAKCKPFFAYSDCRNANSLIVGSKISSDSLLCLLSSCLVVSPCCCGSVLSSASLLTVSRLPQKTNQPMIT